VDEDMKRLTAEVLGIRHTLYGNGKRGITQAVDQLQETVTSMGANVEVVKTKVDNLEKARAKDEHMREGGRRVLVILGTILTILSGLGAGFGYRVLQTVGELAQQLP
jgi:hypothetical protein